MSGPTIGIRRVATPRIHGVATRRADASDASFRGLNPAAILPWSLRDRYLIVASIVVVLLTIANASAFAQETSPDYNEQIAPLLRKYCVGCHGADSPEGKLTLDSFEGLLKGGERGAALAAGRSDQSRLVRVLTGEAEPAMPPEGEAQPTPEEIALLKTWIDGGAKGPSGAGPDPFTLVVPHIEPKAAVRQAVIAVAVSPSGDIIAIARGRHVELYSPESNAPFRSLADHSGHVNAIAFSSNGKTLVAAAGEPGLFGEARVWSVADGVLLKTIRGHRDSLYAARISPDGKLLATGGYDRDVVLWNLETGEKALTLAGHNGAVFEIAFHPRGHILASASADRTVKLWSVATGERLDTLGQSLQELYSLAFSPDGSQLAAAGVDNRIRVWSISETAKEGTNPLLKSIFAHESPVLRIAYTPDGSLLASCGQDRRLKVWSAQAMEIVAELPVQSDWPTALSSIDNDHLLVGRLDGSHETYDLAAVSAGEQTIAVAAPESPEIVRYENVPPLDQLPAAAETEPNDELSAATPLALPTTVTGAIYRTDMAVGEADVDHYRFNAKAGEQWVIEIDAARAGSPLGSALDSKIEVLTAAGDRIERLLLRAVRDSEITFRGVDSNSVDCRVTNWEEMQLNQFLYLNGEVVKLYRAPQGPDSGYQFYPGSGARWGYFGSSALAHPVGQPCYIVEPYQPGSTFPNNGLPSFPLYYENDDDGRRQIGKDSRLTFTAPADGEFVVRVRDVRGEQGEKHTYKLIVRRPKPDFNVTLTGENPILNAGGGKRLTFRVDRIDHFDGEVRIDIAGLPPGYHASTPVRIEAGHVEARAVIWADADAQTPAADVPTPTITATSTIFETEVSKPVNALGTIKLEPKAKLIVTLSPNDEQAAPGESAVTIRPGETVTCKLKIERNGFDDRVQFDVDNLPHGVIVDNIGLNGVLIPEGQTERTVFLTAAPWVGDMSRPFHAVTQVEGNQASLPLMLHVRREGQLANQ
jgi:hypothetical protein